MGVNVSHCTYISFDTITNVSVEKKEKDKEKKKGLG